MSSSISSSDGSRLRRGLRFVRALFGRGRAVAENDTPAGWRRFFRLTVGTAIVAGGIIYAFLVLVDPFDTLPLSPPLNRAPVATNARYAFPALARSAKFDSAIFGTSTSRLLRPVTLDPEFHARFANLAMNDSTAYEQSRLMRVFIRAHPAARVMMVGIDVRWCVTGDDFQKLTPRPFPAWMYGTDPWRGYAEMFNLYSVQEAGQQFGVVTGIKAPSYGRDGYTSFVPPDSEYDPARVAMHLRQATLSALPGVRSGPPATWRFPALELLEKELDALPSPTRKILFFAPYNHVIIPKADQSGAAGWAECKRRIAALADAVPNGLAVDFMIPSPITDRDDNYWDALHYRVGVADRLARDLAAATRGEPSADYRVLTAQDVGTAR